MANFTLNKTFRTITKRHGRIFFSFEPFSIHHCITWQFSDPSVALHKDTSSANKTLLWCLAITDLCVGVITPPLKAVLSLSSVTTEISWKVIYYITIMGSASSFVLCQVNRLQALFSGRVRALISYFWLIFISRVSIYLWSICMAVTVAFALILFSLTAFVFSYAKIYLKLRQHRSSSARSHKGTT